MKPFPKPDPYELARSLRLPTAFPGRLVRKELSAARYAVIHDRFAREFPEIEVSVCGAVVDVCTVLELIEPAGALNALRQGMGKEEFPPLPGWKWKAPIGSKWTEYLLGPALIRMLAIEERWEVSIKIVSSGEGGWSPHLRYVIGFRCRYGAT